MAFYFKTKKPALFLALAAAVIIGGGLFLLYAHQKTKPATGHVYDYKGAGAKVLAEIKTPPIAKSKAAAMDDKNLMLPILMYHHIGFIPAGADAVRIGLTVSPQNFDQQLAWLKQSGYQSISIEDLYLYSQGQFSMPKKPIILTFDDGYDDAFSLGIPILQKYGFTGSFGIITNFPGTTLGNNTYATWDVIKQAADENMEIVCHTENHFNGSDPQFTAAYIYSNLSGCKQALQQNAGVDTNILVYPYGHYTPLYIEQAQKAGFVMALEESGLFYNPEDNLMEIPRIAVRPSESLGDFEKTLTQ